MLSRSKHDEWTHEGDTRIVVTGNPGIGGKESETRIED
jgi:hypothetical protein